MVRHDLVALIAGFSYLITGFGAPRRPRPPLHLPRSKCEYIHTRAHVDAFLPNVYPPTKGDIYVWEERERERERDLTRQLAYLFIYLLVWGPSKPISSYISLES